METNKNQFPKNIDLLDRIKYTICGILFIVMCVSLIYNIYSDSLNKSYAKAVVVGKDTRYKGKKFFKYTFTVDGMEYRGSSPYMDHLESINIGDTCIVRYNAEDPTSNGTITFDNKCSILIKQKTH